jgi:hypothetical protein
MAGFNLSFKVVFFASKFKQFLAACVASDSNVENETYLYNYDISQKSPLFLSGAVVGEYPPWAGR